jgi:cytochrome c peroxidase
MSLKQLVHFYNTRDTTFAQPVTSGHCSTGTTERVDCWPMPEVPNNIDMTVGNLGLTETEESQIVTFLQTLTDGFNPANPTVSTYPDINTFTGTCMTGGLASTQGNDFQVPAPTPLPPCAGAICNATPTPGPSPIPEGVAVNGGCQRPTDTSRARPSRRCGRASLRAIPRMAISSPWIIFHQ